MKKILPNDKATISALSRLGGLCGLSLTALKTQSYQLMLVQMIPFLGVGNHRTSITIPYFGTVSVKVPEDPKDDDFNVFISLFPSTKQVIRQFAYNDTQDIKESLKQSVLELVSSDTRG